MLSLSFRLIWPPKRNPHGVLLPNIHSAKICWWTSKFLAHRTRNPSIHSGMMSRVFLCKFEMLPGLRQLDEAGGKRDTFGGKKVLVDVGVGFSFCGISLHFPMISHEQPDTHNFKFQFCFWQREKLPNLENPWSLLWLRKVCCALCGLEPEEDSLCYHHMSKPDGGINNH